MFPDTVVNALVMSAYHHDVFLEGQFIGDVLVKDGAVGAKEDYLVIVPLAFELHYHVEERLRHQNHSRIRSVIVVIDLEPWPFAVFPEIVNMNLHKAFLDGASYN